jgi:hypothetical protein
VHKAQGSTVDRTYVLATPHFDRHTTYVALSRHRESATMFYGAADFGGRAPAATEEKVKQQLTESLSRERSKDLVHDYLERDLAGSIDVERGIPALESAPQSVPKRNFMGEIDARRQAAADRWVAKYKNGPSPSPDRDRTPEPGNRPNPRPQPRPELRHDGPEDDFEL